MNRPHTKPGVLGVYLLMRGKWGKDGECSNVFKTTNATTHELVSSAILNIARSILLPIPSYNHGNGKFPINLINGASTRKIIYNL